VCNKQVNILFSVMLYFICLFVENRNGKLLMVRRSSCSRRSTKRFEQMCRLQEARQQVLADLQDKNVAMEIDIDQYNLTENSPSISFKPDPCRIPKGLVIIFLQSSCRVNSVDQRFRERRISV
jgi:hypothetical protein